MKFLVDTHAHTIASTHAYSTVHDYIRVAKEKGIKLFAITDHGPDMADAPHFWHFVNMRVLPRIIDGVGVLRGIEANIKNDAGDIDFFGDYLQTLDIVLAGFHEPVFPPSTKEVHTRALINCIESGNVDIITHPGNTVYPIDINKVAAAAAKHNVALEINNSSFLTSRKGSEANCTAIANAVKEAGGLLVMGSDSHVAFSLGNFEKAIEIIEAVEFPIERLLNRSPEALLCFLSARGHASLDEYSDLIE
ncbi:phosphatase [Shewanella sp. Choline-02u-19]|jgi:putative hydrolase|uniref:phosphatase n=1 Tax=unclassified Shewanella TaxID=196818 RepID=UPI000C344E64|nr:MULTISPECIES: phosphatase [unclassified Shewanella]PKG56605.1 phosphatase [Shewanella sp. GutDb-MelDb]PKH60626.1 phosphatase [Shewanella sp. Bg11-22]PKI26946.1 phosphatase [Shewanella sp. Choline-02u-19]